MVHDEKCGTVGRRNEDAPSAYSLSNIQEVLHGFLRLGIVQIQDEPAPTIAREQSWRPPIRCDIKDWYANAAQAAGERQTAMMRGVEHDHGCGGVSDLHLIFARGRDLCALNAKRETSTTKSALEDLDSNFHCHNRVDSGVHNATHLRVARFTRFTSGAGTLYRSGSKKEHLRGPTGAFPGSVS